MTAPLMFSLTVPPPSVNQALTVGTVRIKDGKTAARKMKSKEYESWMRVAVLELQSQRGGMPEPSYWRADILMPGSGSVDLDNLIKGTVDALGQAKKTPDDRYLVDLRIRFHAGKRVLVAIQKEELSKWSIIRNASKSLIRKLAKSYQSTLPLQ